MIRRLPIFPTILVLAAVATMIMLGMWQLDRAKWKADLKARYAQAQTMNAGVPFPRDKAANEGALYRHSEVTCSRVSALNAISGRSAKDENGWAHVATCPEGEIVLGWSRVPAPPAWTGGHVLGFVGPGGVNGVRLVASPPLAGLEANAIPDPRDLPDNHLSYAVQWFLFAGTALVIYALAVRKRLAGTPPPG